MSDERIGSEIAGFRIVSELGHGGMGTVYLAEQSSPRRKVVVKLLRPELSRDDAFRRRFIHESEAAASTEHPNIVPIYSAGRRTVSCTSRCGTWRGTISGTVHIDSPIPLADRPVPNSLGRDRRCRRPHQSRDRPNSCGRSS